MPSSNSKTRKEKNETKNNSKKIMRLNSNYWFWAVWTGCFFSIGYSMTKNIYIVKTHNKSHLNQFKSNRVFSSTKNPFSEENLKNSNIQNKNSFVNYKEIKKIIHLPSKKDSNLRIKINYSQVQNLKNQAVFRKNKGFFAQKTLNSLIKTIKNTKKPKSPKVEAD
tara:strand:+ start:613 stop:1107 length:495 start_codon:yes stop_codon:yes gene_type:complete